MHGCISCLCIAEQTEETKREEKVMTRKIQCCVTALCLLLTAVLGFGIPATVSAAEADELHTIHMETGGIIGSVFRRSSFRRWFS